MHSHANSQGSGPSDNIASEILVPDQFASAEEGQPYSIPTLLFMGADNKAYISLLIAPTFFDIFTRMKINKNCISNV